MSKTEDVRNKSLGMGVCEDGRWGGTTRTQQLPQSEEAAMLQDRLALLNKQEFLRAKSMAEVISRLESLEKTIKNADASVKSSAHEVRAYPAEVVTQLSTRVEVCFARCEDAAARASQVFEKIKSTQVNLERNYLLLLFTACLGVGIIMASMFVFLPKLFS